MTMFARISAGFWAVLVAFVGVMPAGAETFQGRSVTVLNGSGSQTPAPMILLLHGALGSGDQVARDAGFAALASEHGLLVVAPNGIRRRWLDGRQGPDTTDVDYLSALIADFVARGLADPRAIYAIGHSNGGGMAMRLACDRPDLIRGISVIATKAVAAYPCANGAPVQAIFFHGTDDRISPHEGRPAGHRLGETLSADATMALWARRNGCSGARPAQQIDNRPGDRTVLQLINYRGCRAALTQIVIQDGGHGWPGSGRSTAIGGRITREVDAGRASLRFFGL